MALPTRPSKGKVDAYNEFEAWATAVSSLAEGALPSSTFDTRLATRVKVENTAGRTAHVWDASNSRWQLVYGDTGWRDITSLLANGWLNSKVEIRRIGYQVHLRFGDFDRTAATNTKALTIPAGFTLDSSDAMTLILRPVTGTAPAYGAMSFTNEMHLSLTDGIPRGSRLTWTTAAVWPTTLPGTASGTIPNL